MRILQLYPKQDYYTGAAVQLRELARGLRRRGHEVLVATRPSEIWTTKCWEAGLPHVALPMTSEIDLGSVWQLIQILRAHRIQVVHAHKGKGRTLAMMAGLVVDIPVLLLNRGVSFPLDPLNRLGYTSRRVTAIVAVCQSIKQGLVRQGVDPAKIEVIYSGTDTDRFHPRVDGSGIRRELGLGPEHVLVTQIGLRSWKGNDDVLAAMARISRDVPRARLLFVGANEAKATVVHAKATDLGLAHAVTVWPFRDDIPEILAATDVTVDASYAGLGLTGALRESLAVATPVVATDIEGNAELIVHGENGYLVRPRDSGALACAVLSLVSDRGRAAAMGRAGRARVERMFSTAIKVERTEALYDRLLAARRDRRSDVLREAEERHAEDEHAGRGLSVPGTVGRPYGSRIELGSVSRSRGRHLGTRQGAGADGNRRRGAFRARITGAPMASVKRFSPVTSMVTARGLRVRLGGILFRWRSYLPLVLLPVTVGAVMLTDVPLVSDLDLPWEIGCVLLALAGLALRVVTVGQAAPGTSGRNTREQKAACLNTTGIYSAVRHPLYLANSIIVIALALFPRTWILPPLVALAATAYYSCIAAREEQYLRERFGSAFETWAARVPAGLPAFRRYVPSTQTFRWRTVLRREFYGLSVILIAPFFLDLLEDFKETGTLTLEPLWMITALAGSVLFFAFRFVKKRTRHVH